jgi:uncharacterized NAD-dependent epimerase/dehydratase family protein
MPATVHELSSEPALVLADGAYRTSYAKTAHGLVRGPSRWPIAGVIDSSCAGGDAGVLLDGARRGIPVFASVSAAIEELLERPRWCVVGVATHGGVLPANLREHILDAARARMSLASGLHQLLGDDAEIARIVEEHGASIVDVRRPRPVAELSFWSGEVLSLSVPRVAVLGTDCALGKRTTCQMLVAACRERGLRAEMVYTGQTGWMQGARHGFVLDATPNDFVAGELERAILECVRDERPGIVFLEGQSGLRNPAGPCGSELVLSGGARTVVLQHAPARRFFDGTEGIGCAIPPIAEEIELVRLLGARVAVVTLNAEGQTAAEAESSRVRLERELGLPVVLPLAEGVRRALDAVLAVQAGSPA